MTNFEFVVLNAIKEAEETRIKNMLCKSLRIIILALVLYFISINFVYGKTNFDNLIETDEIIAKYEHGGKGYQAISKDNYGGYSYGKWQISTNRKNNKPCTFDFFLKYVEEKSPNIYKTLEKAGGQPAAYKGDEKFIKTWLKLAENKTFQSIYDSFLLDTQIIPVYTRLDKVNNENLDRITTWSSNNKAIQAAIKSTIVQHGSGGAFGIIKNVAEIYKPKSQEEFLDKLYSYRTMRFPRYKSRYKSECKELKEYLLSEESNIKITHYYSFNAFVRKVILKA